MRWLIGLRVTPISAGPLKDSAFSEILVELVPVSTAAIVTSLMLVASDCCSTAPVNEILPRTRFAPM